MNMKRVLSLVLLLGLCLATSAMAEPGRIVLYTVYTQMGWGDRVEVGCVDEDGGLWTYEAPSAAEAGWPGVVEAQLEFLSAANRLQPAGTLEHDAMFALESLIFGTEDMFERAENVADDAGTEVSYALQYDREGAMTPVRLGMSGDAMYENTDPDAQALYARLRQLFPEVTCYSGNMGPAGFAPVSVAEFCGLDAEALLDAEIKALYEDCEAGIIELDPDTDFSEARDIALEGVVTGKANGIDTTGGITDYSFYSKTGDFLGSIRMYEGLIVKGDGMYEWR